MLENKNRIVDNDSEYERGDYTNSEYSNDENFRAIVEDNQDGNEIITDKNNNPLVTND